MFCGPGYTLSNEVIQQFFDVQKFEEVMSKIEAGEFHLVWKIQSMGSYIANKVLRPGSNSRRLLWSSLQGELSRRPESISPLHDK